MLFGQWTQQLEDLQNSFTSGKPFPHVVIDDFFTDNVAEEIANEFPLPDESWCFYNNPIEVKYTLNKIDPVKTPTIDLVFKTLQAPETIEMIRRITDISDLENDPHLHGAGLHYHPRGGKLDMHLDYSIHPLTNKERRLNIIVYMNPFWKDEYGGHLELWDKGFTKAEKRILPAFNRAVLFQTSDISYHGMPHHIACPSDSGRKSLAIYYVSPPRPLATHRLKAEFRPLPNQQVSEGLAKLYEIRKHRILTRQDVEEHFPEFYNERKNK